MELAKRFLMPMLIALFSMSLNGQNATSNSAVNDYIDIYKRYLSGLKNTRCNMYPSCSTYGRMCFSQYPFHMAMIKTADRIIRCGHDMSFYPISYNYGFSTAVDFPESDNIPKDLIHSKPSFVSSVSSPIGDAMSYSNMKFIETLINNQNYASALLEIERLLYFNKKAAINNANIYVNKLKCYEGLKEYDKGVIQYELSFPTSIKQDYNVLFTVAHLYDKMQNYEQAISKYEEATELMLNTNTISPYCELAILYARRGDWDKAIDSFNKKYLIDGNQISFQSSIQIIENMKGQKQKYPTIAMVLSVVPGLGYLYTKQPQSAIAAFLINGALAYAGYTSFKNKNYGLGGILSVLNLSFYFGNIYGAGNSAIRYNDSIKNNSLNTLRDINPYIN